MACSLPYTYDQIKSMVEKQIEEDRGRQLVIMNLAHEFNDACTAKDHLRKAYKECRDIPQDQRALIDNFLKIKSDLNYEMNNALLHLLMNCKLKSIRLQCLFWKMWKAYSPEDFNMAINELGTKRPDVYQKLTEAGVEKWSRAYCPSDRYNYMYKIVDKSM
ncbi:hypothetical protein Tco_1121603 [Tanacetum coccineum]|uniref:Uncharacterized protein n=1 Tax=Tanacetum coccineum TaxID=301880 RepID=A0ABQ5J0T6_9ASTR